MSNLVIEKEWNSVTGYLCRVVASNLGHRCGYVGFKNHSKFFGLNANIELPELGTSIELYFNVHGGITFTGTFKDSDLWWFGYDCGHAGDGKDLSLITDPKILAIFSKYPDEGDPIRTLEYCIEECENLAKQLQKVDPYYLRKEKLEKLLK